MEKLQDIRKKGIFEKYSEENLHTTNEVLACKLTMEFTQECRYHMITENAKGT